VLPTTHTHTHTRTHTHKPTHTHTHIHMHTKLSTLHTCAHALLLLLGLCPPTRSQSAPLPVMPHTAQTVHPVSQEPLATSKTRGARSCSNECTHSESAMVRYGAETRQVCSCTRKESVISQCSMMHEGKLHRGWHYFTSETPTYALSRHET